MARISREARVVALRLTELYQQPVVGRFDRAHLLEVHRRIFQDLPDFLPGALHRFEKGHKKKRTLVTQQAEYPLIYATRTETDARLDQVLADLNAGTALMDLDEAQMAQALTKLYAQLDHLHPFEEGNSRTLREFTRELALHAGHTLDWSSHGVSLAAQERLYLARDREVLNIAVGHLSEQDATMAGVNRDTDILNAWVRHDMMVCTMAPTDTLQSLIQEGLARRVSEVPSHPTERARPATARSKRRKPS